MLQYCSIIFIHCVGVMSEEEAKGKNQGMKLHLSDAKQTKKNNCELSSKKEAVIVAGLGFFLHCIPGFVTIEKGKTNKLTKQTNNRHIPSSSSSVMLMDTKFA